MSSVLHKRVLASLLTLTVCGASACSDAPDASQGDAGSSGWHTLLDYAWKACPKVSRCASDQILVFGESTRAEMCFTGTYRYPANAPVPYCNY